MLNQDILELLEHTKKEISSISEHANNGTVNKVALKNTLENLRSVLDYAAQDILDKLKSKKGNIVKTKVYFPYRQRKNHFLNSVGCNLPNLSQYSPSIYTLVESIQPFISGDSWLVDLCGLTNDAKHNNLSRTENQKSRTLYQGGIAIGTFGEGCQGEVRGTTVNGVLQDDVRINSDGTTIIRKISGQTFIVENNKILFHGKKIEVASFLSKCHKNLSQFMDQLAVELTKA